MVVTYLPWLLSAITIWMTVLAGNKHPSAWLIGLANQALWLWWIVVSASWGLLPMNLALWVVYARNHWKWSTSAEIEAEHEQHQLAKACPDCHSSRLWAAIYDKCYQCGRGIFEVAR